MPGRSPCRDADRERLVVAVGVLVRGALLVEAVGEHGGHAALPGERGAAPGRGGRLLAAPALPLGGGQRRAGRGRRGRWAARRRSSAPPRASRAIAASGSPAHRCSTPSARLTSGRNTLLGQRGARARAPPAPPSTSPAAPSASASAARAHPDAQVVGERRGDRDRRARRARARGARSPVSERAAGQERERARGHARGRRGRSGCSAASPSSACASSCSSRRWSDDPAQRARRRAITNSSPARSAIRSASQRQLARLVRSRCRSGRRAASARQSESSRSSPSSAASSRRALRRVVLEVERSGGVGDERDADQQPRLHRRAIVGVAGDAPRAGAARCPSRPWRSQVPQPRQLGGQPPPALGVVGRRAPARARRAGCRARAASATRQRVLVGVAAAAPRPRARGEEVRQSWRSRAALAPPAASQALRGVLADRLEQAVARPAVGSSATTSDLSTSRPSAASAAADPRRTPRAPPRGRSRPGTRASRRNTTRSGSSSRSWLQAIEASRLACRGDGVARAAHEQREAVVEARLDLARGAASAATRRRARARAATPSSRAHIESIAAPSSASSSANPALARAPRARGTARARRRAGSDGSRHTSSPATPSGSRLVASDVDLRAARQQRAARPRRRRRARARSCPGRAAAGASRSCARQRARAGPAPARRARRWRRHHLGDRGARRSRRRARPTTTPSRPAPDLLGRGCAARRVLPLPSGADEGHRPLVRPARPVQLGELRRRGRRTSSAGLGRLFGGVVERAQRRGLARLARAQLEHALGQREVAQAVDAEVAQLESRAALRRGARPAGEHDVWPAGRSRAGAAARAAPAPAVVHVYGDHGVRLRAAEGLGRRERLDGGGEGGRLAVARHEGRGNHDGPLGEVMRHGLSLSIGHPAAASWPPGRCSGGRGAGS